MTKEQKIAEVKRLKALKAARDAARANGSGSGGGSGRDGNGSGSAASNPNSPITAEAPKRPAKGSYAEIMERAKQIQATSSVPAKIVHKETKVEKKKIGKSDKPEATKKLPAISTKTQGSKPTATSSGVSKPSPVKKPVGRPVGRPTGSRPDDRKSAPAKPAPSKPRVQVEWNGTARPSATAKPSSSKPEPKAYERDRDRERERYRPASKRFVIIILQLLYNPFETLLTSNLSDMSMPTLMKTTVIRLMIWKQPVSTFSKKKTGPVRLQSERILRPRSSKRNSLLRRQPKGKCSPGAKKKHLSFFIIIRSLFSLYIFSLLGILFSSIAIGVLIGALNNFFFFLKFLFFIKFLITSRVSTSLG
ncbi:hypothetical protein AOL_s00078g253 [Orbilia oligospora ATCC 24927]|uniref:Uncharacterized protein n=1 Tax=Arthrobotrys oligospora (strain ATCC 24927 / CBS 115.81 / DSM 1491) TaxID=756982 RepID=G1XBF6_ARTOA|nr:hypothetical protein AOL_s00078g253 [Orbilia oligospora ATCC 24927]EGX49764.1 hypothetical protein AOL_s00078g253 [Orbilia oligospora ATCC 24927]